MKRIPHSSKAVGYFERFDVDALEREIQEIIESPAEYFSLAKDELRESHIFRRLRIATEEEVLEFDYADVSDFSGDYERTSGSMQTSNLGTVA